MLPILKEEICQYKQASDALNSTELNLDVIAFRIRNFFIHYK